MKICPILVAAVSAFSTIAMSHGAAGATADSLLPHCSAVSLPPDPSVPEAIITRVCLDRAKIFQDSSLSIFFVDVPPGPSVMLHRMLSSGYVLVYVLSGTISASAWHAGVGTLREIPGDQSGRRRLISAASDEKARSRPNAM